MGVKNLYRLQFETTTALSNNKEGREQGRDLGELWHNCMGRLHHGMLKILREIVTGLPQCNTNHHDVCNSCTLGKNAKMSFPTNENQAKGILDLVHLDICGSFSSPSLMGYMYYITFIDDHSRKTWIFVMKKKDEVFTKFKEFKA